MNDTRWILTDVAQEVWLEKFDLGPKDALALSGSQNWSVQKRTLRGGVSAGVDVVEVHNGRLSMSILPTRGMGLWKGSCDGWDLGWKSPVSHPVNPAYVNQTDLGGLGWLSGFNELLCRCGLSSNGAPGLDAMTNNEEQQVQAELTLHGKIANIPAHYVEVSVSDKEQGTICVKGVVDETMLFGPCLRLTSTFSTMAGGNSFSIVDEVENLQGHPAELELLYHTNLGRPLLEQGARLVAPLLELAPRDSHAANDIGTYAVFDGPTAGYVEQCYFFDLAAAADGATRVLLRNRGGDRGLSLRFNKRQLPWFTLWKNTQAEADGYVAGLEPATNLPNLKTVERRQGRVVNLAAGEKYTARIDFEILSTVEEIAAVEHEIHALGEHFTAIIHETPQLKFTGD